MKKTTTASRIRNTPSPKPSFAVKYGWNGTVSLSLLTSTPVGFDEPGMCSAQTCRPTTPAITNGNR